MIDKEWYPFIGFVYMGCSSFAAGVASALLKMIIESGELYMKKIEMVIKPEKLEEVKDALNSLGVTGLMVSNVMGYGNQKGYTQIYRGAKYTVNLLPKVKVETVVRDEILEDVIGLVQKTVSSGHIGDGKLFIYDVLDAVRLRTGERGIEAI